MLFSEPGPYNAAGTGRAGEDVSVANLALDNLPWAASLPRDEKGHVLVPVFSDFKRHKIADAETPYFANELLSQRFVGRDEFLSTRLWGVGSTAPYGHRADVADLDSVIRFHGGEAKQARLGYEALADYDRRSLIEFLKSLTIKGSEQ
jgi:CxxC motif-containing protein (DUF1111 family)